MRGICRRIAALLLIWCCASMAPAAASFVNFESGPVRPLALSPDGTRLYAVNTPDARLEIFSLEGDAPEHIGSVAVGLEPVAVASRTANEVWVVNHLSDSVSVVDVSGEPRVIRTLQVGDEPRDIVFAGPKQGDGSFAHAFVTTARRGQNLPPAVAPILTTPGVPRALVWVFDATDSTAGTPETIVELFGDTPRALAATPDGSRVYAAVFHSGNQTTCVSEGAVCNGGATSGPCSLDGIQVEGGLANGMVPGGLPAPNQNVQNVPGPEVGLIVKLNRGSGHWEDELGRNWTNAVRFDLPDLDVFAIDALADPPAEIAAYAHVGTVLFNLLVDPSNGALYVSNTEAHNEVRFEGAGNRATTVRGHLHEARITVIDDAGVHPRHLNKHILETAGGYRTAPMPAAVRDRSLAIPLGMAIDSQRQLYVAAFGSAKIGVFNAETLADDSFVADSTKQIELEGGGPAGLVLDEARQRLYALTLFDNTVRVIDTVNRRELAAHPLHSPVPAPLRAGRRFLYDARLSSSNGEASCASCHVFGDFDSLAWDLGNPEDTVHISPNPSGPIGNRQPFHPLKGPMTTQTLRGLATQGPMHWRGDRTGGQFPGDPGALDEQLAFESFNVAFGGLLGRDEGEIPSEDMAAFARFALSIASPPNPIRALDNRLTSSEAAGELVYMERFGTDGIASCNGCHTLDPSQGFFGTGGLTTFENEPQEFKVAPLKHAYQKVGMFGMPDVAFVDIPTTARRHQGDQVRGFGFLHDGSIATVADFLHATVFSLSEQERNDLQQFIFAFDSTFAPVVGQQVTLTGSNAAAVGARLDLLRQRAATAFVLVGEPDAHECDLVVWGVVGGKARGYLFDPVADAYRSDRIDEPPLSDSELRRTATTGGQELNFTCAPPGEGVRLALDRDGDGFFDRDEIDAGSDPADPTDTPETVCSGDCDDNAAVTVDEIVRGVDIALGNQDVASCAAFDVDGSGRVTVDELLRAVNAALSGC